MDAYMMRCIIISLTIIRGVIKSRTFSLVIIGAFKFLEQEGG
jgi:hypothetical protein